MCIIGGLPFECLFCYWDQYTNEFLGTWESPLGIPTQINDSALIQVTNI